MFGGPIFKHFKDESEHFQEQLREAYAKLLALCFLICQNTEESEQICSVMNSYYLTAMDQYTVTKMALFMNSTGREMSNSEDVIAAFGIFDDEITKESMNSYLITWNLIVAKDMGFKLCCEQCNKETEQVCGDCGFTLYCSRKCQKMGRREHRDFCKSVS